MIVILGLDILLAAVIVGVAGVLSNGGSGHALTQDSRCSATTLYTSLPRWRAADTARRRLWPAVPSRCTASPDSVPPVPGQG
jgi:hypothetical protein